MTKKNDPYAIPTMNEDVMACHAEGESPEGYDSADSTCHNCVDKFTCLPAAVRNPKVWTSRKAKAWAIEDDVEVSAVLAKTMTYDVALDRMRRRDSLRLAGKEIPTELVCQRSLLPEPSEEVIDVEPEDEGSEEESEEEIEQEEDASEEDGEDEDEQPETEEPSEEVTAEVDDQVATNNKKKPVRPKKATKAKPTKPAKAVKAKPVKAAKAKPAKPAKAAKAKPAKPAKAVKPAKAAKAKPVKPAKATKAKPTKPIKPIKPAKALPKKKKPTTRAANINPKNGKALPLPRSITVEEMTKSMGKIKLGMAVDFDFGMQIVRRARSGKEHVVTLTKNGYLYEDEHYSSLSAAAQNASGTPCRSGNDWFNLANTSCTEVRDSAGEIIARKGMNL